MRAQYTVSELCDALEVSRSGHYKSIRVEQSERQIENGELTLEMKAIHQERFKRAYGSPGITVELQRRGFSCSENRLAEVAEVNRPGEVVASDITSVATAQGWLYLAVTLDLFRRQIAGWHLAENMETALVIQAAQKATTREGIGPETIYHSDRGCQYTSKALRTWLAQRGMISSMSAAGFCYDNAACESFFATLKRESFPENCVFDTKEEARRTIFEYIETFYNRTRIHTSLENTAPNQFLYHFQPEKIPLN